jgi:hypothetical protein
MSEFRQIGSTEIRFWQGGPQGRWIFAGSINAGGYLTIEDAMVEAVAQVDGKLRGRISATLGKLPKQRDHAAYWQANLETLANRR